MEIEDWNGNVPRECYVHWCNVDWCLTSVLPLFAAQTIMKFLWMGKSLSDSISDPIVHVRSNCTLNFEPEFDKVIKGYIDISCWLFTDTVRCMHVPALPYIMTFRILCWLGTQLKNQNKPNIFLWTAEWCRMMLKCDFCHFHWSILCGISTMTWPINLHQKCIMVLMIRWSALETRPRPVLMDTLK